MRYVLAAILVGSLATAAHAQGATCKVQAADKKLAGAAQKSFLTKCEKDAKSACEIRRPTRSWLAPPRPATSRNASATPSAPRGWFPQVGFENAGLRPRVFFFSARPCRA